MLNKKERMEKMNAMGIDTGKFFTVNFPEGLKPGSKITLSVNENGECTFEDMNKINDPILNQIIEDGYVRNTKLHRRFVMAQMFQALNYKSHDDRYEGYNDCIKRCYGYKYTIDMMIEEVRVLSKLEIRDRETFEERAHFFDRRTIAAVLEDYVVELERYVDKLPTKKCKGVPYKRVKSVNIFEVDLKKKLYVPVKHYANQVLAARNYNEIYRILCSFKRNMVKLPWDTRKSKAWLDAYKGEGAYYTLKNLVMFHDCGIKTDKFEVLFNTSAVAFLDEKLDEYKGEGWRMFALMKKVIADNNFDFNKRMNEIYNK